MARGPARDPDAIVPTVPEDWTPPAWITGPKYSKRELQWLTARLDENAQHLRQQLFRLREELRRHDEREQHPQ